MIINIGDLHGKNKQPYKKTFVSFLEMIRDTYPNDAKIFYGDGLDSSSPHNEVRYYIEKLLSEMGEVYIFGGNHDQSRKMGNGLLPLKTHKNITLIEEVTELTIEGHSFLFIPFKENAQEEYEQLTGTYDFVATHITPLECAFNDEGVQLNLDATFIHGHTHMQTDFTDKNGRQHYVLGVPYPTRNGENQEHRIGLIGNDKKVTFEKVPIYFQHETIKYGEMPSNDDNVINVIDAPDKQSVLEMYSKFYIREAGIELKRDDSEIKSIDVSTNSIKPLFSELCEEKSIKKEVVKRGLTYLETIADDEVIV